MPSDIFLDSLCSKGIAYKRDSFISSREPTSPNKLLGASNHTTFYGANKAEYIINLRLQRVANTVVLQTHNGEFLSQDDFNSIRSFFENQANQSKPGSFFSKGSLFASIGGTMFSIGELHDKPIILGAEYKQINTGGTVIRNTNRIYTTTGKIARTGGRICLYLSIIFDILEIIFTDDEEAKNKALFDIGANVVIATAGFFCPPAGIVLGLLYLTANPFDRPEGGINHDYEAIHKSIAPRDNTRVETPLFPLNEKTIRQTSTYIPAPAGLRQIYDKNGVKIK